MNYKKVKQQLIERDGLKCAITGEPADSPEQLDIEHLMPVAEGGKHNLDNLILIKPEVNRAIGPNTDYRTKLLLKQLRSREEELAIREKEAYERERQYRKELEVKTAELNEYRHRLSKEQAEQEKMISQEIEARKSAIKNEEIILRRDIERLEKELLSERKKFNNYVHETDKQFEKREKELSSRLIELKEKERKYAEETKENLQQKSSEYVNEALTHLKDKEDKFHRISRVWAGLGGLSIILGISLLMWFGSEGIDILKQDTDFGWSYLFLVTFKGVILVGLFIALAKYSFTYSQSYMHESIKNSERRHAINFGKFYMESYGASANWHQIKDAFEHWNIECESAFSKQDSNKFDPKAIEGAVSLLNAVRKLPEAGQKKKEPDEANA